MDDQFVDRSVVEKLTSQFSAAADPDILSFRCRDHLPMHWPDLAAFIKLLDQRITPN